MKNLNKIKEKIDWDKYYSLNDKQAWILICIHENLSEEFIREFKDKVEWTSICKYQKLSEEFIEEMSQYIDWYYIFAYQENLSHEFKRKHKKDYNKSCKIGLKGIINLLLTL